MFQCLLQAGKTTFLVTFQLILDYDITNNFSRNFCRMYSVTHLIKLSEMDCF